MNEISSDASCNRFDPGLPTPDDLDRAVRLLRQEQLVGIPTETVYGLGAFASSEAALAKLFAVKGRPKQHPVIVHLASAESLTQWAQTIPDIAYELAEAFWPGPLTLLLAKQPWVSDSVTGGLPTVGLRVPRHASTLALLSALNEGGVAAPSANRFGQLSPTQASHVRSEFQETEVPFVLDGGPCGVGVESTILDLSQLWQGLYLRRPGGVTVEAIQTLLRDRYPLLGLHTMDQTGTAPGTLSSHYAPRTPCFLKSTPELEEAFIHQPSQRLGVLAYSPSLQQLTLPSGWVLQPMPASDKDYAAGLYEALRRLDNAEVEAIWVEAPPVEGSLWLACQDRLRRACYR
jgi:L-threonylcarbamoyladenylate synthase